MSQNYENIAVTYLKEQKFTILHRNFKNRWGEIDIIAQKGTTLYFIEVKGRKTTYFGHPIEFVHFEQMRRISHTAKLFMHIKKPKKIKKVLFSVIGIVGISVQFVENAFDFID